MRSRFVKISVCTFATMLVWGFSIFFIPSVHAQSPAGFTPAIGTIKIGSQVFPIVPQHPTTLHRHLSRHPSPAYPSDCKEGGFWIDMGDSYKSGNGHDAEADVYGLYDSPTQNGNYCGEVYCYGAGFADPHNAPVSNVSLNCSTSANEWGDFYSCSLPSGGLNGSVCGMDSNTYYNVSWGEATTTVSWYVSASTGERWG